MSANLARAIVGSGFGINVGLNGYPSGRQFLNLLGQQLHQMGEKPGGEFPGLKDAPPVVSENHHFGTAENGVVLTFDDTGVLKISGQPRAKINPWGFLAEFNPNGVQTGDGPGYRSYLYRGKTYPDPIRCDPNTRDPQSPENNMILSAWQKLPPVNLVDYYSAGLGFRASADLYVTASKFGELLQTIRVWVATTGGLWTVDETKSGSNGLFLNYISLQNLPIEIAREYPESPQTVLYNGKVHLRLEKGVCAADVQFKTPHGDYGHLLPPALLTFIEQYAAYILTGEGESGNAN